MGGRARARVHTHTELSRGGEKELTGSWNNKHRKILLGRVGIMKVFLGKGGAAILGCPDWQGAEGLEFTAVCTAAASLADSELLVVIIWARNPSQEESLLIPGAGFMAKGV